MANTIKLKRNSTAGVVPSTLADGELAVNTADVKLYIKNSTGAIVEILGSSTSNPILAFVSSAGTIDNIVGNSTTTMPFYTAAGTLDNIPISSNQFPFYKNDGTQDNIGV